MIEPLPAARVLANKRLFPCVRPLVRPEVVVQAKLFPTNVAAQLLFAAVGRRAPLSRFAALAARLGATLIRAWPLG